MASSTATNHNKQRPTIPEHAAMRRYVGMLALAIVLLFSTLWAALELGRWYYLDPEFGMWQAKKTLLARAAATPPDTLIIGDSRAMAALNPDWLPGEHGYNLALGGGTTVEAYYVLKRLTDGGAVPDRLVLSFVPFHLEFVDAFWARTVAFRFLPPSTLAELYADGGWRVFGETPLTAAGWYLGLPYFRVPALRQAISDGLNQQTSRRLYRETLRQRGWHSFGRDNRDPRCLAQETALEAFTPDGVLTRYLQATLELARVHGIKVYYLSTPYSTYNITRIHPQYLSAYRAYIAKLARRQGVTMIPTPAVVPLTMMGDCSHVNARGAKLLSRLTAHAISRAEYPAPAWQSRLRYPSPRHRSVTTVRRMPRSLNKN